MQQLVGPQCLLLYYRAFPVKSQGLCRHKRETFCILESHCSSVRKLYPCFGVPFLTSSCLYNLMDIIGIFWREGFMGSYCLHLAVNESPRSSSSGTPGRRQQGCRYGRLGQWKHPSNCLSPNTRYRASRLSHPVHRTLPIETSVIQTWGNNMIHPLFITYTHSVKSLTEVSQFFVLTSLFGLGSAN